jgi:hypothetical protein
MITTLTLEQSRDEYTALKDLADILTFVYQSLDQSEARRCGMELELSATAVAGCVTLLESIVAGLHQIAERTECPCACHKKKEDK